MAKEGGKTRRQKQQTRFLDNGTRRNGSRQTRQTRSPGRSAYSAGWLRCYPFRFDSVDDEDSPIGQPFGDLTSLVNALRMRRIYRDASLRLLADLVYVARGTANAFGRLPGDDQSDELDADYLVVKRAAESSACLYRSLRLQRKLSHMKERPYAHPVILAQEKGLGAPVDALAQLLAAAIARQFGEAVVAVTFDDGKATARLWIRDEVVETMAFDSYAKLHAAVAQMVEDRVGGEFEPFFHVIVAAPRAPEDLPDGYRAPARPQWQDVSRTLRNRDFGPIPTGYDRILYLTRNIPEKAPEAWAELLGPGLRSRSPDGEQVDPQGPYFCSFIATIVPPATPRSRENFQTELADLELQDTRLNRRSFPAGWRLRRDRCRLPIDLDGLRKRWSAADVASAPALTRFVEAELASSELKEHMRRWARAVTNRQVGVALSGGGASSYRFVPLLKSLDRSGVPIDLVSGISGGALLGAYYCALGIDGVELFLESAPRFQLGELAAIFRRNFVRDQVDKDLSSAQVEGTDVRFVAVATALLKDKPPETRVVVAGTLGEAAQASGAAPLLFSPVEVDGTRYSDGASATLIPARVLKDWGADYVFAFNCLPGPLRRNPLDSTWLGRRAYRGVLGRVIDAWVSVGSMMQRLSREACEDAHVYFEPEGHDLFLVESFLFIRARQIARKLKEVEPAIEECEKTWRRLSSGGLTMGERNGSPSPRTASPRSKTARNESKKARNR